MATAKRTTSKKTTTAKTAATKTTKKKTTAPAKRKAPAKDSTSRSLHTAKYEEKKAPTKSPLRLQKDTKKFLSFSPNRETLYWIILGIVVIGFTLWILKLQSDIADLYDQIEISNAVTETMELEALQKEADKEK